MHAHKSVILDWMNQTSGISRALLTVDPDFRSSLKSAGLLTRDARMKERRKPGLKKARKASQFSKR